MSPKGDESVERVPPDEAATPKGSLGMIQCTPDEHSPKI